MRIWPAIDISKGKCIRLRQGDFSQETVFAADPSEMAAQFAQLGATHLHVVDLDGARQGTPQNLPEIEKIRARFPGELQVGGGLRSHATVADLLGLGVDRAILGTAAITSPELLQEASHRFPRKIALGLDSRDGIVAVKGWLETSGVPWKSVLDRVASLPLAAVIVTDIATDGMLAGPNLSVIREVVACSPFPVIASGGVSSHEDLVAIEATGASDAIIGRAFYEGRIDLARAIQVFEIDAIHKAVYPNRQ
jgi:phosphoribosylformimino-5-aminoimidazole carboxamide ribotide isomerase